MISKEYGKYTLECDCCGRYHSNFDTFADALDYAKDMGWEKKKENGEWINICEDCQNE